MKLINGFVLSCCFSSLLHAGSMGPEVTNASTPYLSLEGSYTWNQLGGVTINGVPSVSQKQGFGGRLAAGILRPYKENLSLGAEFGGGYYGNDDLNIQSRGTRVRRAIDGYDFLVGAFYQAADVNWFAEIGAMVQGVRVHQSQELSAAIAGGLFTGVTNTDLAKTQMLPEIKVGGIYKLYQDLSLSLAYMYVFGVKTGATVDPVGTTGVEGGIVRNRTGANISNNANRQIQNPALSSLMLGLRYHFT